MDLKALQFKAELNNKKLVRLIPDTMVEAGDYIDWNDNGAFTTIAPGSPFVGLRKSEIKVVIFRMV